MEHPPALAEGRGGPCRFRHQLAIDHHGPATVAGTTGRVPVILPRCPGLRALPARRLVRRGAEGRHPVEPRATPISSPVREVCGCFDDLDVVLRKIVDEAARNCRIPKTMNAP